MSTNAPDPAAAGTGGPSDPAVAADAQRGVTHDEHRTGVTADRRHKLDAWRASGERAFPTKYEGREEIAALLAEFEGLENGEEAPGRHAVAGRLMAKREHGKIAFFVIKDGTGRLQLFISREEVGETQFARLLEFDVGDILGAAGPMMRTRRGELSLKVGEAQLLTKALRPLPEKFHGLTDVETRYRRRYLDLIVNDEVKETFIKRARIISSVRRFLDDLGFVEVETPILQPLYGGAMARPFVTHHNELERDLYLRIAVELYLKRCIVGGIDKVYEIGKDFRNEGISFKHNPEFTMLETYEAYVDYNHVMDMVEQMLCTAARAVGDLKVQFRGQEIDLTPPWPRLTMRQSILDESGIDILAAQTVTDLQAAMKDRHLDDVDLAPTWGAQVDELFSAVVEPKLIQPVFITEHPVEVSPFAKKTPHDERVTERFESFVAGMETSNAFSELNDADDQRARFVQQLEDFHAGDESAHQMDEDFLEAMEHGMPPTGGMGMGLDRITMLLTDSPSIRDVILFPQLRS
jgi:lysyl-tRNA synthetase class 2